MNSATLGEICDRSDGIIQTGPFGSQLHRSDYRTEGTPVVMPQDIVGNRLSMEKIAYIDETLVRKLGRHLLAEDDIVFPRRGEISKRAIIGAHETGYFCGTGCLKISIPPVEVLPQWLFYYLGLEHVVKWIEGKAVGATMLNLNTGILRSVPIEYPTLGEQKRVVEHLSVYDNLIENNQRRIALLEESAQLLYREWFMNMRYPPGQQTFGSIPTGWEVKPMTEMAVVNRASLRSKDKPEAIQYIDIASVETGLITSTTKLQYADAPGRARRLVQHGDVIWSCVRPNRRSYAMIWNPDDDVVVSTGFAVLTAKTVPFTYLYLACTSDEFVAYLTNRATGAAYPAVSGKDFEEAQLLCPDQDVLLDFHERCSPFFELRSELIRENGLLVEARDALLPKLMSGEIQV